MSSAEAVPARSTPLRVAFAGTPEFAKVALQLLLERGFDVPIVLTQPDRPAGRGLKLQPSAVKALALAHRVPTIQQPRSLRLDGKFPDDAAGARVALENAGADVMVVAAYGLILPQWVLSLPRLGCLNIHASLLPRWRGAAPIHRAIEAGDRLTGITLMQMDAGLDTGDMLRTVETSISPVDTTSSLHDRLAQLGGQITVEALRDIESLQRQAAPQPEVGVTYAHKIEKSEAAIDWSQNAVDIERRVRAFDPFPGACTSWQGELLKVWRSEIVETDVQARPGEVLDSGGGHLLVACGQGALRLLELQKPGGKRLPAAQCLQSNWPVKHSLMASPAA